MPELDDDISLEPVGGGRWHGRLSDRWNIGAGINGGYLASFVLNALRSDSPAPDPLTMTVHYVQRPRPGPAAVTTDIVRAGRSHATVSARLEQAGAPVAVALATFGEWRPPTPIDFQPEMPTVPDPDRCVEMEHPAAPDMTFLDRFRYRVASPEDHVFARSTPGSARSGGWIRLADRELDALAVPLVMDAWPPAIFASFLGGGAPTIELTVHWRGRPGTVWHLARFASRQLAGGYVEEDGELWTEDGRLVAQSRQLARFVPPG
ncbi:MAG TPA: thioesterase family protein [Acidimicrobiales bacterium]|nr:thioesterase family protein [Acidimicrobiales bacterium]